MDSRRGTVNGARVGSGGLGAIRRIRQWDPEARIVVFSVHENPLYKTKSFEAGAIGYVSKRCAPLQMLQSVREAARGRSFVALGEPARDAADRDEQVALARLTLREFEVFRLLALGHPLRDVARRLNISHNTAGVHQTRIMKKLGLRNAAQLARLAIRHGIVSV